MPGCHKLLALFITVSVPGCAQEMTASLRGQVADPTQAPVPGTLVKLVRRGSSAGIETRTDAEGHYAFPSLLAGFYDIQAFAPGFKSLAWERLSVPPGAALNLPLVLELGSMSERVTVGADTDPLQTATASRAQNFDPVKLLELPLIGRQAYSLMSLTPGVLFTQEALGSTGLSGLRGWDANGKYIINGGKEGTNQFLMNGAPVSLTGKWQIAPNIEAIQEFQVLTNTYDARYGRTGGGTVNTTIRSGGNDWHGSVFEFFHNAVFDANSIENNREGAPRGKHITHQFGGVLGGPIRKDKDLVFFAFEGFREVVPFPVVSDTPPLDLRDGQHFSAYGIRVFDPLTARRCRPGVDTPSGVACFAPFVRSPFPGNVIPSSRISQVGRNILALYPAPNETALTQNYLAPGNSGRYRYDQPLARWDRVFGDRDRLYSLFTYQHGSEFRSINGFPDPASIGYRGSQRTDQNYVAEWTHIVSPATVFSLRASFGRFTEFFPENDKNFDFTAEKLGILQFPHVPTVPQKTAPRVDLDLYSSIIGNSFTWSTQNQWDLAPSLTRVRGRHVLHLGGEFVYAAIGNAGPGRANGQFLFTRGWTQQNPSRPRGVLDGSGVADLLLGAPSGGFVDYNGSFYRTWPYFAGYVQDNWKVRPRLTVSLGLRYDVQVPFLERFNRVNAGFDFSAKNPLSDAVIAQWKRMKVEWDATRPVYPYPDPPAVLYGGKAFATRGNRRPYDTDWTNLQPRFGVAWQFAPHTLLRAGFGIFHRTATQMNFTDGFSQRTNYTASLDGGVTPSAGLSGPYSLENPFPNGIVAPSGSALGLLTNVGRATNFDGRQRLIPRTVQYSIGLQRHLPWGVFLEASYSGSQTVHDTMNLQLDAVSSSDLLKGQQSPLYLSRRLPNPFFGILPQNSDLGSAPQIQAYDLLRPLPLFNGITQQTNPWAKYRYDSLQIQAERRVLDSAAAGTMMFMLSYTFSKSFEASHRLNNWNLAEKPIHELTAFDKPHTFGLAGYWELPIGWGRRWLTDGSRLTGALTNGWSVDWILTYYAGYPVSKPDSIFLCDSYFAPGGQTPERWFNNDPKCYQARPLYSLRTVEDRFSNIRNPAAPQLNVSVEKTFWLSEKVTLQFRGESFNVTNTPILPGPNTNFRDPRFGQLPLQQNNFPRFVQLAAKILF
jgi:hypothetical protein